MDTTSLQKALEEAVVEGLGVGGQAALLFSGGLDSSLLGLLAIRHCTNIGRPPPRLITVGLKGSHDLKAAVSAVGRLEEATRTKVDSEIIEVTMEEVQKGLQELLQIIGPDPRTLGFLLPLHLIVRRIPEPVLISGQGADELLGGYSRYQRMGESELERALKEDTHNLRDGIDDRDGKIVGGAGKELVCPYLDPVVVTAAEAFSSHVRRGALEDEGKALLRRAAEEMGLPTELAHRPKKAAQYGTGFEKVVKAHFKELHTATLELDYPSSQVARAVLEATALDNPPFVAVTIAGSRLTVKTAARTIGGLEQTLDDFLACADAAAKVIEKTR